ncbi:hypothetical protein HispidOSU_001112, partial [Sigmodon hispidus]
MHGSIQRMKNSPVNHFDSGSKAIFWNDNHKESTLADHTMVAADSLYFMPWGKGGETVCILLHCGKSCKTLSYQDLCLCVRSSVEECLLLAS